MSSGDIGCGDCGDGEVAAAATAATVAAAAAAGATAMATVVASGDIDVSKTHLQTRLQSIHSNLLFI